MEQASRPARNRVEIEGGAGLRRETELGEGVEWAFALAVNQIGKLRVEQA